jgi:pSer/pThr/pTyr-binding forkhead associated (FHA) protein
VTRYRDVPNAAAAASNARHCSARSIRPRHTTTSKRPRLQEGWTRIGRSLSAHIRFDDPTVSRRHALVYCDTDGTRVLDDRSLNGVFLNGDRVELAELEDGDEIDIGRFRVFFVSLVANRTALAG